MMDRPHPGPLLEKLRVLLPPAPAGTGGFGWDAIFIPKGTKKTFAEMSPEEKDAYSMRRQALEKMVESELEEVTKVS
jgi:inosine/xanthosine triphosphate pyrophosphatase family protein